MESGKKKRKRIGFSELLKMVNEIPGDFWISFTSSHPKPSARAEFGAEDFSWDDLIKTMIECQKISKYISLPIQSGDDEILKKMNRPYTVADYQKIVAKIRKAIPDVYLSTDVIVGFPGETKKQFANTMKLFKKLEFDMTYIAEYSPRPGTAAFKMKDDVSLKEKQQRREALTEILEQTAIAKNKKYIGKIVEVLINGVGKNNPPSSPLPSNKKSALLGNGESENEFLVGKTKNYKTVKIVGLPPQIKPQQMIGRIVKAKVVDIIPWGLKAELEIESTQ